MTAQTGAGAPLRGLTAAANRPRGTSLASCQSHFGLGLSLRATALGCEYATATFEAQRLGYCPENLLPAGELESVGLVVRTSPCSLRPALRTAPCPSRACR